MISSHVGNCLTTLQVGIDMWNYILERNLILGYFWKGLYREEQDD